MKKWRLHCLHLKVFSRFKRSLIHSRSRDIVFFEEIVNRNLWVLKLICITFFCFVCGLSASAGNLLILFSPFGKNQPIRVICRAGKWPEIMVTVSWQWMLIHMTCQYCNNKLIHIGFSFINTELHSKNGQDSKKELCLFCTFMIIKSTYSQ